MIHRQANCVHSIEVHISTLVMGKPVVRRIHWIHENWKYFKIYSFLTVFYINFIAVSSSLFQYNYIGSQCLLSLFCKKRNCYSCSRMSHMPLSCLVFRLIYISFRLCYLPFLFKFYQLLCSHISASHILCELQFKHISVIMLLKNSYQLLCFIVWPFQLKLGLFLFPIPPFLF